MLSNSMYTALLCYIAISWSGVLYNSRCSTNGSTRKKLLKHKSYRNINILRSIMF